MRYVFDVRVKSGAYLEKQKVRRVLAVPETATLEDLCGMILRSIDFDFDHLYMFTVRGQSYEGAPPEADRRGRCRIPLRELELPGGEKIGLLYDFGDEWNFELKLQEPCGGGDFEILRAEGELQQYPDEDEWDDVQWEADDWGDQEEEWEEDGEDWDED